MAPHISLCTVGTENAYLKVVAHGYRNKVGRKGTTAGKHGEAVGSSCHITWKLHVAWILSTRICRVNKTCCHQPSQLIGIPQEHTSGWDVGFSFTERSTACNTSRKSTSVM